MSHRSDPPSARVNSKHETERGTKNLNFGKSENFVAEFCVILQAVASLVVCFAAVTAADQQVEQVTQQSQELETAESKPKRSIGGGKLTLSFFKSALF